MRALLVMAGVLGVLCIGGLIYGCGSKDAVPEPPSERPLAQVNGVSITEDDYAFEVRRRQDIGRPLGTPTEILQDLVQRQVMLQKAEKSEIMQDPAIRRELESRQLGQWLDRSLQVERDQVRVSDADMRAYYDERMDTFTRPEAARLAMLYRRVNAHNPDEAVALRAELGKARADYLADRDRATKNGRLAGFGSVAERCSEDTVSRYRGGDLGWIGKSGTDGRLPPAVSEVAFALADGAVSAVIAAGDGLYVIMKSDSRPARVKPFEDVAPTLRRKLIRLKQDEVEHTFVSNLMSAATIEINENKVDRLAVPTVVAPEPPVLLPASGFAPNGE